MKLGAHLNSNTPLNASLDSEHAEALLHSAEELLKL